MEYRLIPQRRSRTASGGRYGVAVLAVAATCVVFAACGMDSEPPTLTKDIPKQTVQMGTPLEVDLSSYFKGSSLTYSAESANTGIVTVAVSGKTLTLTAVKAGNTTVKATAKNANGTESSEFTVTVPAPVCQVDDVLTPGDSCEIPGNGGTFRVTAAGSGCIGGICGGTGLNINQFSAEKIAGTNNWRITALPSS